MPSFDATDSFVAAAHGLAKAKSMMPNGVLLGLWTQIGWLMLLRCRRFFRFRYPWRAPMVAATVYKHLSFREVTTARLWLQPWTLSAINFSGGGFCEAAIAEGLAKALMPADTHPSHCPNMNADLKSMVSAGLASLSCNYDLLISVYAKNTLKVLCIRHGGGSLPLFLASKIPGVMVDIVETDPVVISQSL
ncbi:hypothetical protein Tco_0568039 [Tanacetum coccineum]